MFEGQVIAPGNSPHLRKSGSRSVVSDLVSEQGNGAEESFMHSVDSNDMKTSTIVPISTAAIMPSPIFLWRFKVLLFFLWGFSCCKNECRFTGSVSIRGIFVLQPSSSCDYDGLALGS